MGSQRLHKGWVYLIMKQNVFVSLFSKSMTGIFLIIFKFIQVNLVGGKSKMLQWCAKGGKESWKSILGLLKTLSIHCSQTRSLIGAQAFTCKLKGSQINNEKRSKEHHTNHILLFLWTLTGWSIQTQAIIMATELLSKTETRWLLPNLPPDPYSYPNLDSAFSNSRSLKLSLALMWVEWTSTLLCTPRRLKIPKSPHIIQEATEPCQGKRPRSPSCLINYILRLHSPLPVYFSCIKTLQTINHLSVLSIMSGLIASHILIITNAQNSRKKIWTMKWYFFFLNTSATLCD